VVNHSVIASFDPFTTLAQIAGADINALKVDGESCLNVVPPNRLKQSPSAQFWVTKMYDYPFCNSSAVLDSYAVRAGDRKLAYIPAHRLNEADKAMFFNMEKDPAEARDLLAAPAPRDDQLMLRLFGAEVFSGGEYDAAIGLSYQAIVVNSQKKYYR
jgi:hypothetical protein